MKQNTVAEEAVASAEFIVIAAVEHATERERDNRVIDSDWTKSHVVMVWKE